MVHHEYLPSDACVELRFGWQPLVGRIWAWGCKERDVGRVLALRLVEFIDHAYNFLCSAM